MKKRIITSILAMTMATTSISVYGIDIEQSKEKLNQASEEKKALEEKLGKKSKEVDDMMKEIEEIDSKMRTASEELQKAQKELEETEAEVKAVSKELEEAEKTLKDKQKQFGSRVSVMYKNSTAGYLEVVLGASDVVDLLNRVDMIKDIAKYDKDIILEVKEQKEIINKKSEELKVKQEETREATRAAEVKRAELEAASDSKIAYMETLKNDEMAFRSSIARLEAESSEILNSIKAEEDRIAAEANSQKEEGAQPGQDTSSGGNSDNSTPEYIPPSSGSGMVRPAATGRVSSEFGPRWGTMHKGIDIAVPTGTPIMASADGVVARSYYSSSYGEVVYINHGGGMVTIYAHNSRRTVSEGQTVSKGQVIAYSGNTGDSTGPHLHFEVVINGSKVNPRNYVNF